MNTYTKPLALVSSILLSASLAGPAQATPIEPTPIDNLQTVDIPIVAQNVALPEEEPKVTTIPASRPASNTQPVAVEEASPAVTAAPAPAVVTPAPAPTPVAVTPKAAEPVPQVSASGKGATIAAAAYAQIGIAQDCTALVSNALAAAGINFHGWPRDYMTLGTITATPSPGDLIYYDDAGAGVPHIAVYVGNGMAIHGGFNGSTVLFKASIGSGPVYIHIA